MRQVREVGKKGGNLSSGEEGKVGRGKGNGKVRFGKARKREKVKQK